MLAHVRGGRDAASRGQIAIRGLLLVLVATFLEVPAFLAATLSGPSLGDEPGVAIPGGPERRWVLTVFFALGTSMVVERALHPHPVGGVGCPRRGGAPRRTALTTPGPEHFDTLRIPP